MKETREVLPKSIRCGFAVGKKVERSKLIEILKCSRSKKVKSSRTRKTRGVHLMLIVAGKRIAQSELALILLKGRK